VLALRSEAWRGSCARFPRRRRARFRRTRLLICCLAFAACSLERRPRPWAGALAPEVNSALYSASANHGAEPDAGGEPEPPASERLEHGESCSRDGQCESAHCERGICCAEGHCCLTSEECASQDGTAAICDDFATCQGSRGATLCLDHRCVTRQGVADDTGCGVEVRAHDCGPYRSVQCSGEADQAAPRCPEFCRTDDDCDPAAHCDAECLPDLPDGSACEEDSDCASAHCGQGKCCAAGDCCKAASDCIGYSWPARCVDPMNCQGTRTDALCLNFRCGSAVVPDDSACGATTLARGCGAALDLHCSGAPQQTAQCDLRCGANDDTRCDADAHCSRGSCVVDLADGQACEEPSDCRSGHCDAGLCCAAGDCCQRDTDCSGGDRFCDRASFRCEATARPPTEQP
jgi:hypothetical protein